MFKPQKKALQSSIEEMKENMNKEKDIKYFIAQIRN